MNNVTPSRRLNACRLAVNDAGSRTAWLPPRNVWTGGRGRSVGSANSADRPAALSSSSGGSRGRVRSAPPAAKPQSRRNWHGQIGKRRRLTGAERRIQRRELPIEHAHRPRVRNDVVQVEKKQVALIVELQQSVRISGPRPRSNAQFVSSAITRRISCRGRRRTTP